MDWKLFSTTFVTIFIAEMGDKTQIAAFSASAHSGGAREVVMAVVLALVLAGLIGVLLGKYISLWVSPQLLRYCAGAVFIAMGLWFLIKR